MSETVIIRPNSYQDVFTKGTGSSVTDPENAYNNDLNNFAKFYAFDSTTISTARAFYPVDFSIIPNGSTVTNITFYASVSYTKGGSGSGSAYEFRVSLYGDTTRVVSWATYKTTSQTLISRELTEENINTILTSSVLRIRSEVSSVKLKDTTGRLYDVYLEVTYEPPLGVKNKVKVNGSWVEAEPYVKVNGAWEKATNAFIKVNGNWEEII